MERREPVVAARRIALEAAEASIIQVYQHKFMCEKVRTSQKDAGMFLLFLKDILLLLKSKYTHVCGG